MKYGRPDSTWSEHDRITYEAAEREQRRNRQIVSRFNANRRAQFAAGMMPHPVDENDPWAGTIMRHCDSECSLHHRGAA